MSEVKKHKKRDDILESINKHNGPTISVLQKEKDTTKDHEFEQRIEKLIAKGKFFGKIYSNMGGILVVFFAIVCAVAFYYFYHSGENTNSLDFVKLFEEKYQCRMDMRVCSDGSIVNRVPPECDFAVCSGFNKNISQRKLTDRINNNCTSDTDCSKYISENTCQVFCASEGSDNENIIYSLQKTCDSTLWDPFMDMNCKCINNKCKFIK